MFKVVDKSRRVFFTKIVKLKTKEARFSLTRIYSMRKPRFIATERNRKILLYFLLPCAISTFRTRHFSPFHNTLRQWYKYPDRRKVIVVSKTALDPWKKIQLSYIAFLFEGIAFNVELLNYTNFNLYLLFFSNFKIYFCCIIIIYINNS